MSNKAQIHVFAALTDVVEHLPFPIRGIDNGSEFINDQLFRYCQDQQLTFTRSRSGNKNDGAHVEGEELDPRQLVGYLRYDTRAELLLLNKSMALQSLIGNHYYPQQKLLSKVRDGAKITKTYDTAITPYARIAAHPDVLALPKRRLATIHTSFNPRPGAVPVSSVSVGIPNPACPSSSWALMFSASLIARSTFRDG